MDDAAAFFTKIYAFFNERDVDALLALMSPQVEWGNGMEGGHEKGRQAVRAYWTRQWTMIDPRVEPRGVAEADDGRMVVDVHQLVRDLDGNVLSEGDVRHIYTIENGLIARMDIEKD